MSKKVKIEVRIEFSSIGLSTGYLAAILKDINEIVYRSNVKDFNEIRANISFDAQESIAFDAATYRLSEYRHTSTRIKNIETGSIYINLSVAGVTLWLIQNTFGATLREGWTESSLHERIKDLLNQRLFSKIDEIIEKIEDSLPKKVPCEVNVSKSNDQSDLSREDIVMKIVIITRDDREFPPNLGDAL